jgi:hypothetical protein
MKDFDLFRPAFHDAAFCADKIKDLIQGLQLTRVVLVCCGVLALGFTLYRGVTAGSWDGGLQWLPTFALFLSYLLNRTRLRALQVLSDESNEMLKKNCRECLLIASVLQRPPRSNASYNNSICLNRDEVSRTETVTTSPDKTYGSSQPVVWEHCLL